MTEDLASKVSDGKIQVIREGYDKAGEKGRFHAKCTVTLIRDAKLCLVDAGREKDKNEINEALRLRRVLPGNIGRIFLTHNHPDHMLGIVNFNAAVYAPDSFYDVGNYKPSEIDAYEPTQVSFEKIGEEIQISENTRLLATHGHSGWDMSIVYQNGQCPKIAIVGDLFWSEEDFYENNRFQELCVDLLKQEKSREHIREIIKPEIIVPGHGAAFKPEY